MRDGGRKTIDGSIRPPSTVFRPWGLSDIYPEAVRSMQPTKLKITDITMKFRTRRGAEVLAVDELSLEVADREFVSIVGPSGCGKSTLLRVVAGLVEPSSGQVLLN